MTRFFILTVVLVLTVFCSCDNTQQQNSVPQQKKVEVLNSPIDSVITKQDSATTVLMKDFYSIAKANKNAKQFFDKAIATRIRTKEMENLINDIKMELIHKTMVKGSSEIPTKILIGSNVDKPDGRATELKTKLNLYLNDIHSWLPPDIINSVKFDIDTEDKDETPWETNLFCLKTLDEDLVVLSKMKVNIRNIEHQLINIYYDKALNK